MVTTWVPPFTSVMVTVTVWPASTSVVVPVISGVLSLVKSGAFTVMMAVVSILPVSVAEAVLPEGAVTVACAKYAPSAKGVLGSTE